MSAPAPTRIQPFYEVPGDLRDTILLQREDAELRQGEKVIKGSLSLIQQWMPFVVFVEFSTNTSDEIEFGNAHVKSKSLDADIRVVTQMSDGVRGYCSGNVEVGSDHKLDRVTFHLPNYPDLEGKTVYDDESVHDEISTSIRWSEIILENDGWRIALQPHPNAFTLRQNARFNRTIALNGVGEIRRLTGESFKKKDVRPIIEGLRVFLSFAVADWLPPLLVVGSNSVAKQSWRMWGSYDIGPQSHSRGWLDDRHGYHLTDAYPGFCKLWQKEDWRIPFTQAVTWLIEASRQTGNVDGAIAFGQIPLEMLTWLVFVEDRSILDAGEFDKLSAANKLQLLFSQCGIALDVPRVLEALTKVATSGEMSGPRIATEVRNTVIHPQKKNRAKLPEWESKYGVKADDLRWETQQLFKWYITLVLLSLIDYRGEYANRLTAHKYGSVEPVPWASS